MKIEWPGKKHNAYLRRRRARRRTQRKTRRRLYLALAVLLGILYLRYAPDNYNLIRPIDLTDRPTFVTDLKLRLASAKGCYDALERANLSIERLPDKVMGSGCTFEDVGRLDRSLAEWGAGITLTCPMLAGIAQWERHVLQPAARKYFDSEVVHVNHFGTYSCRNVNNAKTGRRSEHATANAVDVAGFVLADGTEISVLKHWDERSAEGRFLGRVHKRACQLFDTVLGPEFNQLHRDHFHFDMGGYESCR